MNRKRCAVVGIGHRSHSWIPQIVKTYREEAELVALCDPAVTRCHDANKYFGANAVCYDDYDRMLSEAKPDLVIVVSPEHVHTDQIVKALDAGCEVATEKPLCTKAEEAVRILDAQKRNGKKVFMGFNYRHIPLCSKIKETILSGAIGTPVSADLTWYLDYRGHGASYFRRWHRLMEKSGGLLITKATHHFDLANWWLGDRPESVFSLCALNFFGKGKGKFKGTRCRDCAHKNECEFFFDVDDKIRRSRELGYKVNIVRDYEGDTCVFSDDIDIYDTMAVMVRYNNGAILNYSLNASVPFEGWNLAINGTKGRLESKITDNKPSPGWQQKYQIADPDGRLLKGKGFRITDWPAEYNIHVMPHYGDDYEIKPPNIADGHGGGDFKIFDALFKGTLAGGDPLGLYASAIDGVSSMIIGAAANKSAATGQPVEIKDMIGDYAG
ncbi:MAG: Gfo/Idh/MocA family oxidoreductase [Victivallales bacterium]|jgi:predicted dehydrogenase